MENHRISFIHYNIEYSFIKAIGGYLEGYELMVACRAEVRAYMKKHNLKGK